MFLLPINSLKIRTRFFSF